MGASAGISAGRAFVELYAKDDPFVKAMDRSEGRLQRLGRVAGEVGREVMAAGAAMVASLTAAVTAFAKTGDTLDKMSARTGLAVEYLSRLGYAARIGGTDIGTMEMGIKRLQRTALDAQRGLSTAVDAFDELGVSVTDSSGRLKETDQLFNETMEALAGVENHTKKAALAQMLFGRSGTMMLPMLREGKRGFEAIMEAGRKYEMTAEEAAIAAELTDKLFGVAWAGFMTLVRVGGALAESISEVANTVEDIVVSWQPWIQANQATIVLVAKLAVVVTAAGATLVAYSVAVKIVTATSGALAVVNGVLAASFSLILAHPIMAWLAGLAIILAVVTRDTIELNDEMSELRAAGDRQRQAYQDQLSRLGELADKTRLTSNDQKEARDIIRDLERSYGDLGLSIDEATGKVIGFGDAQRRMNEQQREDALAQIRKEMVAVGQNKQELIDAMQTRGMRQYLTFGIGDDDRQKDLERQVRDYEVRMDKLMVRFRALKGGDTSAATGEPTGEPTGPDAGDLAEDARSDEALRLEEEMADRLLALRISQIEDAENRALAAVMREYQTKFAQARKVGADISKVEAAYEAERAAVHGQFAAERAKADREAAEEAERRATADREQRNMAIGDLERQVTELEIRNRYQDDEPEQQRQLLEFERSNAIADAANEGFDQERFDLINQLYDLRAAALDLPAAAAASMTTPTGTFSGSALAIRGLEAGGSTTEERIAAASEATAENTANLDRRVRQGTGLRVTR